MIIEICSKETAIAQAEKTTVPVSMISISSPEEADTVFPENANLVSVLFLRFSDLFREYDEEGFPYGRPLPRREDFRGLKEFVSALSCERLIIHCFEGTSRSAAVAAAVYEFRSRNDELITGQRFAPNPLVYSLTCEELGIPQGDLRYQLKNEDGIIRIRPFSPRQKPAEEETDLFRYWYEALLEAAAVGEKACGESDLRDPLSRAKMKLLWILHSSEHLKVFISDGEPYLSWDSCGTLSESVRNCAVNDVFRTLSAKEDQSALSVYLESLRNGVSDAKQLLPWLEEALSEERSESLFKTAEQAAELIRHQLYRRQAERREALSGKPLNGREELPSGMDEFAYIDWVITHPDRR